MEVSTFFRLWDEIEKKRAKPTIEVEGNIVDGKLVLSLEKPALNVSVRDNAIITPYERIIVRKAFFDQTFLLKSLPWRKERMMSHGGISAREGCFEC